MGIVGCGLLFVLSGAFAAIPLVYAQYPNRPVRIIVPTSTGAAADFAARLISQPVSERLGQQVLVGRDW